MYLKTAVRRGSESLDAFIDHETSDFTRGSEVRASREAPIGTLSGRKAQVRQFSGEHGSNLESVAYLEERPAFVVIVLSAQTAGAYQTARSAFVQLVKSYQFIPPAKSSR